MFPENGKDGRMVVQLFRKQELSSGTWGFESLSFLLFKDQCTSSSMAEHLAVNQGVEGSSPSLCATGKGQI